MAGRVGELTEVLFLGRQDARLGVSQSGDDVILGSGGWTTTVLTSCPAALNARTTANSQLSSARNRIVVSFAEAPVMRRRTGRLHAPACRPRSGWQPEYPRGRG